MAALSLLQVSVSEVEFNIILEYDSLEFNESMNKPNTLFIAFHPGL